MKILDDNGRLFGKVNLIDAAVVLLVLVLIPLAYGSWVLFRTRPPVVASITPASVEPGKADQTVQLKGQNLRPFLRVFIGTTQATYLFISADVAELRLPSMAPGAYDLAFFDEAREIIRKPNALVVGPAAPPPLPAVDTFLARPMDRVLEPQRIELQGRKLRASLLAYIGTQPATYQFETPERAILALPALEPGVYDVAFFEKDGKNEKEVVRFTRAVTVVGLEIVLRAPTKPEVVEMIKSSQVSDKGQRWTTRRPVLMSYQVTDQLLGTTKEDLVQGPVSIVRAVFRVAAVKAGDEWHFDGRPIRAGQLFTLQAPTYVLDGHILSLGVTPSRTR